MGYLIEAWLEDGIPHVRVRDAATGDVRLRWSRAVPAAARAADGGRDGHAGLALQGLFKGLVLLSCASNLALAERAGTGGFGEECLGCDECVAGAAEDMVRDSARVNQTDNIVHLRDRRRTGAPGGKK